MQRLVSCNTKIGHSGHYPDIGPITQDYLYITSYSAGMLRVFCLVRLLRASRFSGGQFKLACHLAALSFAGEEAPFNYSIIPVREYALSVWLHQCAGALRSCCSASSEKTSCLNFAMFSANQFSSSFLMFSATNFEVDASKIFRVSFNSSTYRSASS